MPPKAKKKVEKLPELDSMFCQLFEWPDVSEIMAGEPLNQVKDAFAEVAQFRDELKAVLAPCYKTRVVSFSFCLIINYYAI